MVTQIRQVLAKVGILPTLRSIHDRFLSQYALRGYAQLRGMAVTYRGGSISLRRGHDTIRFSQAHGVYGYDMVNFFDYYFSAVVPTEAKKKRLVDYSAPKVHRLSLSGVEFEFPSLPESDESTEIYLDALALQPGDCVLDLGAYAGASSYFFSQIVGPAGQVIAFEPDQKTYPYLLANIARHGLTNVKPVQKGVWSETTTLRFQSEGNMGSAVVSVMGRDSNSNEVPVVTLDDAAALAGVKRIAGIKMDIEGAEVAVLERARDFLRHHRPRLVVEPHMVGGCMTTQQVSETLRSSGYHVNVVFQGSQQWPLVVAIPVE